MDLRKFTGPLLKNGKKKSKSKGKQEGNTRRLKVSRLVFLSCFPFDWLIGLIGISHHQCKNKTEKQSSVSTEELYMATLCKSQRRE